MIAFVVTLALAGTVVFDQQYFLFFLSVPAGVCSLIAFFLFSENMQKMEYTTEITSEDTFSAVIRLVKIKHKVVALDFASGTNPGGGWRGKQCGTQEEKLCRTSNLGLLLEALPYPMPKYNTMYYIPNVRIAKDFAGHLLPTPVDCAVVASELKSLSLIPESSLRQRIQALYELAVKQKHTAIVLGCWGCGAFSESEEDVLVLARQFAIYSKMYPLIKSVFAVYTTKHVKIYKTVFKI